MPESPSTKKLQNDEHPRESASSPESVGMLVGVRDYVRMARPDHWFKNVFMVPGLVVAAGLSRTPWRTLVVPAAWAGLSACLIASANYVINEWVDADYDRFHPVKRDRPAVRKRVKGSLVCVEYAVLMLAGLALAAA